MRRGFLALAVAVHLGCGSSTAPSPLYSHYTLMSLDGQPLPVAFGQDGTMLVSGFLDFGTLTRPRGPAPVSRTVKYGQDFQRPDQTVDHSETELDYTIQEGMLRIDLCPSGALCIASTELVGPFAGHQSELVLTHYLAGKPMSVYRFGAAGSGGAK